MFILLLLQGIDEWGYEKTIFVHPLFTEDAPYGDSRMTLAVDDDDDDGDDGDVMR